MDHLPAGEVSKYAQAYHRGYRILALQESSVPLAAVPASNLQPGDSITIKDGAFNGFKGLVDSVDNCSCKVTVLIEIFGRPTPIYLESWQIEID